MAGELIITVSGLRGIVGENLTPQVAADYGRAFGSFLRSKFLTRISCPSVWAVTQGQAGSRLPRP